MKRRQSVSQSESESESELLYDWRFTASQFVLATSPLRPTTRIFIFQLNISGYRPYVTSFLTREWVCCYSCCWSSSAQSFSDPSPAGLMTTFYCLKLETPQPGEPCSRIYIPQELRGPVTPPGTGFPFRRLLRLAGLRWRYSTPPPQGILTRLMECR
jgi:hypothetical protein